MPKLTKEERETIIRFDDSAKTCDVYTCSQRVYAKLMKKGFPMVEERPWGWRARTIPLKAISFRSLETMTKLQTAAKARAKTANVFGRKPTDT